MHLCRDLRAAMLSDWAISWVAVGASVLLFTSEVYVPQCSAVCCMSVSSLYYPHDTHAHALSSKNSIIQVTRSTMGVSLAHLALLFARCVRACAEVRRGSHSA